MRMGRQHSKCREGPPLSAAARLFPVVSVLVQATTCLSHTLQVASSVHLTAVVETSSGPGGVLPVLVCCHAAQAAQRNPSIACAQGLSAAAQPQPGGAAVGNRTNAYYESISRQLSKRRRKLCEDLVHAN